MPRWRRPVARSPNLSPLRAGSERPVIRSFLDCGEIAVAVALAYDWLYDKLAPRERRAIENAILRNVLEPALCGLCRSLAAVAEAARQLHPGIEFGDHDCRTGGLAPLPRAIGAPGSPQPCFGVERVRGLGAGRGLARRPQLLVPGDALCRSDGRGAGEHVRRQLWSCRSSRLRPDWRLGPARGGTVWGGLQFWGFGTALRCVAARMARASLWPADRWLAARRSRMAGIYPLRRFGRDRQEPAR